jgi:hypothetical protein
MPISLHSSRRRIIGATCGVQKSIDEVGTGRGRNKLKRT